MAVATRRRGLTLWLAWVAAASLGTALSAWATPPLGGSHVSPAPDALAWVGTVVVAAPVALLQFLVLRVLLGVSPVVAGIWAGVTIAVAVANGWAYVEWYSQIIAPVWSWATQFGEAAQNFVFRVVDYFYPLALGLAQGVLLARIFGAKWVVGVWVVANVVASVASLKMVSAVLNALHLDLAPSTAEYVFAKTALEAAYSAITGLVLVVLLIWREPRALAPAVRLPQEPTP